MQNIKNICTLLFKYKRKTDCLFNCTLLARFKSSDTSNTSKLNILFFGTDQFSLRSLILLDNSRKCGNSKVDRLGVVTSFKGNNAIKKYAEKNSLECNNWQSFNSSGNGIKYDLGVVVSFGHLIPENVINMFPLGMINVHASLLPRWRGAAPIIYAILNEDPVTGVSIMRIRPSKFDIGEVLAQKEVAVPKNVLMPELHNKLANEGAELLIDCIDKAPESLWNAQPQDESYITYAPKVDDSMAHINWQKMTARYICNLYRALYSFKWFTTHWHDRRVRFRNIVISDSEQELKPDKLSGTVEYDKENKWLRIYCSDGGFINVTQLSLEGKSTMNAAEFNNGFLKKVDFTKRCFS